MTIFFVKPDQFKPDNNGKVRGNAPTPAVNRTFTLETPDELVRAIFTKEWQFFAADLLALAKYEKVFWSLSQAERKDIKQAFASLYGGSTAFTNRKEKARDYVNEDIYKNPKKKKGALLPDMKIDALLCAGNFIEGEVITSLFSQLLGNAPIVRVNSFNALSHPPIATLAMLADKRVQWANIINANGSLQAFPQLRDGRPVPYPLLASKTCYYYLKNLAAV